MNLTGEYLVILWINPYFTTLFFFLERLGYRTTPKILALTIYSERSTTENFNQIVTNLLELEDFFRLLLRLRLPNSDELEWFVCEAVLTSEWDRGVDGMQLSSVELSEQPRRTVGRLECRRWPADDAPVFENLFRGVWWATKLKRKRKLLKICWLKWLIFKKGRLFQVTNRVSKQYQENNWIPCFHLLLRYGIFKFFSGRCF